MARKCSRVERVVLPGIDQTLQRLEGKPDAPPTATLAITPQPNRVRDPDGESTTR